MLKYEWLVVYRSSDREGWDIMDFPTEKEAADHFRLLISVTLITEAFVMRNDIRARYNRGKPDEAAKTS